MRQPSEPVQPGEPAEVAAAGSPPRPRLHFTPPANWMNDPNGLVVIDDTFHLFYQHNPSAARWGNLHWGHAVSHDLMRWDHRPVAIAPDHHGEVFSGTAVIDSTGSAGFGAGALIAVFTQDLRGLQRQSLAYSLDDGDTWTMYAGNPVLDPPTGATDFRDPKVLRYATAESAWWVMLLAVGPEVWVYRSTDLRLWHHMSAFAVPTPWPGSVVEVPELVRVPIEGTGESVWTLILGLIPPEGAHRLSGRARYLEVDFDGETITSRHAGASTASFDGGRDFYAAMVWDLGPADAPVCVGWLDESALGLPEDDLVWCGRLSLPRQLTYVDEGDRLRLRQQPMIDPSATSRRRPLEPGAADAVVEPHFVVSVGATLPADEAAHVRLLLSSSGERVTIMIDRAGFGLVEAGATARTSEPPGGASVDRDLVVVVDAGSIELICDEGRGVISEISRLGLGPTEVTLEVDGPASVRSASIGTFDTPGEESS